ncbi:Vacuolar protein sorting-associated protein 41 [Entophlyctis luteolus]|nr:Vacuolar protein sorting-associated protein 41 [Entophlyctis luteolus]
MVGWADSVKICVVKDRAGKKATDTTRSLSPPSSNLNLNLPTKYVEIVCEFRTEFIISGIAPLRDQIVLLAFITDTGDRQNIDILPTPENNVAEKLISEPPEVHVVDMNGDQVANDVLSLFGFEHYRANDYRLAFLPSSTTIADTTFYIVSPKDIVVAKPRDLDDHIEFLVSKARYEEALAAAERATVNKREVDGSLYQGRMRVEDVVSIGIKYLTSLMQDGDYEQAAAMTPKILRTDPKLWEQWIYSFMGIDKLAVLLPFIPFSQLQLNKAVYEMILSRFLETDERTFLDLIQQWPSNWYSAATVADGVEVKLAKDESNSVLLDAAVKLCTTAMRFEKALVYGLRRRKPNILDLVEPHNLFQALQANVVLLLEYDFDNAIADEDIVGSRDWTGVEEGYGSRPGEYIEERVRIIRRAGLQNGVALLVAHTDRAPPAMIVKTFLQSVTPSSKKLLHIYLDALFRNDSLHDLSMPVHTMQVELYAEFDPTRLIDFLRSPEVTYDVQRAFALCEIRDLVPEMVFLLGKMGDNRRALKLLIERVGNVQQAIDFAKEQNDNLLWDDLIKFSMNKPAFIAGLLENLGSHIDPVKLIRSIPEGLPIPNLRKCLIKIMTDYGIQMSLREGCGKIIVSDTVKLMEGLYNIQRRAVIFSGGLFQIVLPALINVSKDKDLLCSVCENKLSFEDQDQHIVLYFCRHMYHNSCLLSAKSLLQSNNSRTGVSAESLVNAEERDDHVNKENQHVIDSIYDSSAGTDAEARLRGGSLNLMAQYGLDGGLWDDMGNLRDTRPSAGEDGGPLQELSSLRCSDSSGVRSGSSAFDQRYMHHRILSSTNAMLFTPSDFEDGVAAVAIDDMRVRLGASTNSTESSDLIIPSTLEFSLTPTNDAICSKIVELCKRHYMKGVDRISFDEVSNQQMLDPEVVLKTAAECEARILAATEVLDLDPSPDVERRETLASYNKWKYRVYPRSLAESDMSQSAKRKREELEAAEEKLQATSHGNISHNRLMFVNGIETSRLRRAGSSAEIPAGISAKGSGDGQNDLGGGSNFEPRFSLLEFVESYRKRKAVFDAEIMMGLDTRKSKPKLDRKDPEYLILNGMKVIRTARFEQVVQGETIHSIINVVESNASDEYHAVLRIGSAPGTADGPYGTTLRYPVGNFAAVDSYLGNFKTFYGLTNKVTNLLVNANNPPMVGAAGTG